MDLSSLILSAVAIFLASMFVIIGISYIAYKLRRRAPYQIR